MTNRVDFSDGDVDTMNSLAVSCLLNHALCSSKLGWFNKAISDCSQVG